MGTFKHPISGTAWHSSMNSLCQVQTFAVNAHILEAWWQAAAIPFLFCEVTNTKLISGAIPSNSKFNCLIATPFFVSSCMYYLSYCTKGRICELWPHKGAGQLFLCSVLQCTAGIWTRKVFCRILCRKIGKFKSRLWRWKGQIKGKTSHRTKQRSSGKGVT